MSLWKFNLFEPNAEPTHQGLTPATSFLDSSRGAGIGADHCLPPYIELIEPTYIDVIRNDPDIEPPFVISYLPGASHLLQRYLYEPGQTRYFGGTATHPGIESFNVLNAANLGVQSVIYWSEGFVHPVLFPGGIDPAVSTWFLAFDLQGVAHVSSVSGSGGLPNPSWVAFVAAEIFPRTIDSDDHYYTWFSPRFSGYKNGFNPLGTNSFDDPYFTELVNTGLGEFPDTTVLESVNGFDNQGADNGERWWKISEDAFGGTYILQDDDRLLVRPWWP